MKKLFSLVALLLLVSVTFAQTIEYGDNMEPIWISTIRHHRLKILNSIFVYQFYYKIPNSILIKIAEGVILIRKA